MTNSVASEKKAARSIKAEAKHAPDLLLLLLLLRPSYLVGLRERQSKALPIFLSIHLALSMRCEWSAEERKNFLQE